MKEDFDRFAASSGVSSLTLHDYRSAVNAYINPTVIEERRMNVATMDVFSRLMLDRVVFLGVPIDDDVANIITAQLLFLAANDPKQDISLYINTPGGQVSSGLAIYDTMQLVEPDVNTICMGMAASMGSVLLCAGAAGKRSALPHSRVLIHQPLGGASGQASDIEIAAREILKTKQELYRIISQHSGQSIEKIAADADRDFWMTAQEAKDYGMVDGIVYSRKNG
ncbi:MAG: ATP-dependent Clp protease proteolytic subunit [Bacteroidales bacterium]|nr:ATP-dependent Clp protease proteolytic subunit [Bacteroidales bacterium]